ncbi:MAG: hypothetical protein WD114_06445 [Phycisphaerales bacterium]
MTDDPSAPSRTAGLSPGTVVLGIEMSNPTAAPGTVPGAGDEEMPHAVALWRIGNDGGAGLIGSAPLPRPARGSDAVMALVESLCADRGVEPAAIGRVLVSIGPGGYTALRISTTTAKVLAMTLGCQLVGVPTARNAAEAIADTDLPALIALASKKDRTHATIVGHDRVHGQLGVIDASALEKMDIRSIVSDRHLPESMRQVAAGLGIEILPIVLDARSLMDASRGIESVRPEALVPLYAREPDAVTQWRARAAGPPAGPNNQ